MALSQKASLLPLDHHVITHWTCYTDDTTLTVHKEQLTESEACLIPDQDSDDVTRQ
jgi:hypothetical protein